MKYRSRITSLLVILALMLSMLASCDLSGNGGQSDTGIGDSEPEAPSVPDSISIRGDDEIELALGDTLQLIVDISVQKSVTWVSSSPAVSVEGGLLSAEAEGSATVTATLGSASDSVTVTVIDDKGEKTVFTITTNSPNLRGALEQENLIEGDEGEYGLYVKVVNGIRADYDKDGAYWGFYKDGVMLPSGVDDAIISNGDKYEIKYEKA